MLGKVAVLATGVVIGVVGDRVALELRKPPGDQFPGLRKAVNDKVNPWLLERGYPGSAQAEIGVLEHLGRTTGQVRLTPVHPTLREEVVLIPAPLGEGSQWARNVLSAGSARLQLREELLDLDGPELVTVAESGLYPAGVAAPFDRLGWRYVRFHVVARVPGTFAMDRLPAVAADDPGDGLDPAFALAAEPTELEPLGAG